MKNLRGYFLLQIRSTCWTWTTCFPVAQVLLKSTWHPGSRKVCSASPSLHIRASSLRDGGGGRECGKRKGRRRDSYSPSCPQAGLSPSLNKSRRSSFLWKHTDTGLRVCFVLTCIFFLFEGHLFQKVRKWQKDYDTGFFHPDIFDHWHWKKHVIEKISCQFRSRDRWFAHFPA